MTLPHQDIDGRVGHRVFFTPPWEAIWSTYAARRHSLAEATAEYERLVRGYKELGYQIIVLPRTSVNDRVEQILRELHAQPTRA
ncbi:AAA family ATPase [Gordonia sp. ABSL11-1]|uniref:AAA family ATPase n=1 Tax=Gordonia sp. ABSL11-1 TaxID=3053924 RepID=UPI0025730C24|nr:AAA family ATPase [Gordonia sp. ABSL11-1]MDL9945008.1 AAA family ATPase [Gordonia sp. ABSL11-1]